MVWFIIIQHIYSFSRRHLLRNRASLFSLEVFADCWEAFEGRCQAALGWSFSHDDRRSFVWTVGCLSWPCNLMQFGYNLVVSFVGLGASDSLLLLPTTSATKQLVWWDNGRWLSDVALGIGQHCAVFTPMMCMYPLNMEIPMPQFRQEPLGRWGDDSLPIFHSSPGILTCGLCRRSPAPVRRTTSLRRIGHWSCSFCGGHL